MLVSVIIPYFNDEANIERAVKSALTQTYKKLEWSPDAIFLCCVAGQSKVGKKSAIHLFHRSDLTKLCVCVFFFSYLLYSLICD